jgi:hypothetical protein
VFAAATTDLEYTLRITDRVSGVAKTYFKALGAPAPAIADTNALAVCGRSASAGVAKDEVGDIAPVSAKAGLEISEDPNRFRGQCAPGVGRLCLAKGRFEVSAVAIDFNSKFFPGQWVPLWTESSALFWFFGPENWELMVKVLDGCSLNKRYWVFTAASTNVYYTLIVRDSVTGIIRYYHNPQGQISPAATDTDAFAGCPE